MRLQTLLAAAALALAATAHAADPHDHAHGHEPKHGGVVVEVKDMDYELVARATLVQLYLRDHGRPVDVSRAVARLTLLTGSDKQEVELRPAGDRLEAAGRFTLAPGTKAVVVVTVAGRASTARFALK